MTAWFATEPNTEYIFAQLAVIVYHLLTESEVITGKSQTEALMYWPSDSEVNTDQDWGLRFPCIDRRDEVNKLFIVWPV